MKVAVVTGAGKGLGREIALALAKKDFVLALGYRTSQKEAKEVLGKVSRESSGSIIFRADLTSEEEVSDAFGDVLKHFGRVDLLVNNVGDFLYKKFGETTNREFKQLIESNLYSTLFCSRAVLPAMRKQKSGQIINIGAVGADRIVIRQKSTPYFIGKTGVYILTKMMAWEEAKHGIRVNMISPASLVADIFKPIDFPMGRSASYQDVVKALLFLISSDASYINGANIEVAGGFVPGIEK